MPSIPPIRRVGESAISPWPAPGVRTFAVLLAVTIAVTPARAASPPPTESTNGLVVSAQRIAAQVGADILRQGGNAIDAAVAVGYAEAVVNPCCGNIGGGGFLTAHLADGRDIFIDFRETAPAAATRNMFLDDNGQIVRGESLYGWKAVGVPGTVLGLDTALAKYGTMPRSTVMAPAIRLARNGFVLNASDADLLRRGAELLRRDENAAKIYLHSDSTPYRAGERLQQPALAATLEAIAAHGPDAFYRGHIPETVEKAARGHGGVISATDFAAYHVNEAAPIRCTYRGYTVISAPPPSSGGTTICETLNVLEGYDLKESGFHSAQSVHVMTEALRLSFFDRNTFLGDPAFVSNPLQRLLSKAYAERLRGLITDRATPSASLGSPVVGASEHAETTHYSILDEHGAAVAVTYTLNGGFGAGVMAGDTGFLLNDEMDDFTLKPGVPNMYGLVQGPANAIAPGKRPLSSMAPTIVLKGGDVAMVLGSPGGSRIISAVLETIRNMIDYDMSAQEAVDAPRVHHQWMPDVIYAERYALSPDTEALLRQMGYQIQVQAPWGAVELIASGSLAAPEEARPPTDQASGQHRRVEAYYGANDSRRPAGAAIAP